MSSYRIFGSLLQYSVQNHITKDQRAIVFTSGIRFCNGHIRSALPCSLQSMISSCTIQEVFTFYSRNSLPQYIAQSTA